jgi:hypothetical protein
MKFSSRHALGGVLLACLLSACSTLTRDPPVPAPISRAAPFEIRQIRFLPFEDGATIRQSIDYSFKQETADNYSTGPSGERVYNYLAISGGGSDGAFGAGLIHGWTESGIRPHFKIVTGVSTGALIAPFAFLGPDYDDELKASYTTIDSAKIFIPRGILPLLWSEAAASTEPLQELIETYITEAVLEAIAAEHAKGRRLYVASTNLDAEQPVIWDMGAIASSSSSDRLTLFRKVLLASASIPSMFPPVFMDVAIDGNKYQEMHVDGGVFFQSFFVGSMIDLPSTIRAAHPDYTGPVKQHLYVIRNGWVSPTPQPVQRALPSISMRAILSMLKVSGINDLWRLYLSTRDDDVQFHYVAIPADYVPSTIEQFNREEMNREFNYGREMALKGIPWRNAPPGYAAPQEHLAQQ